MVHNGGISEDDIAAGYIPACSWHPMGRVEIDARGRKRTPAGSGPGPREGGAVRDKGALCVALR